MEEESKKIIKCVVCECKASRADYPIQIFQQKKRIVMYKQSSFVPKNRSERKMQDS